MFKFLKLDLLWGQASEFIKPIKDSELKMKKLNFRKHKTKSFEKYDLKY